MVTYESFGYNGSNFFLIKIWYLPRLTVKLTKPWTPKICLKCLLCNTQSQVRSSTIEDGCIVSVTEIQIHDCIVLVFTLFQDTPSVLLYYWKSEELLHLYPLLSWVTFGIKFVRFWKTRILVTCTVTQVKQQLTYWILCGPYLGLTSLGLLTTSPSTKIGIIYTQPLQEEKIFPMMPRSEWSA